MTLTTAITAASVHLEIAMTKPTLTAAARRAMFNHLACDPDTSATALAESAAITLGHDEWLDDQDHWIWDFALEIGDQA